MIWAAKLWEQLRLRTPRLRAAPASPEHQVPSVPAEPAAQAEMYRMMVENTTDLIIRYDAHSARLYVSPACREILGFEPIEVLGMNGRLMIHPDDREQAEATFRSIGPTIPSPRQVFRSLHKDGHYVWLEARYRHLPNDDGVLAVLRDVTASKRVEEKLAETNAKLESANQVLRELAQQDGLTGLANRRYFDELIADEFRRARRQELPLGLVLLDVDCFKSYNDRYGHLEGDDCLRRISTAVAKILRRPGDHAARYGGEEIAVLLPATDDQGAVALAERIRIAICDLAIPHQDSSFGFVTISAGACALIPFEDDQPAFLIGAADRALYRAKSGGRNLVRRGSVRERNGIPAQA